MKIPRGQRWALAVLALVCAGCSDPSGPRAPLPPFVFTSNAAGLPGIHLWEEGVITRLSSAGVEDSEPHSAAGRIVFRSRRDGNGEIYIADHALQGQQRLTEDPWDDSEPAVSPAGDAVLFVSNRSGTPRLWAMDPDGGNQRILATGSSSFVPERAPAWGPAGDQIAFTSTRTGTSQVFVLRLDGSNAVQVTHEATGAFLPSWSSDGRSVIYTTLEGGSTVRIIPVAGGQWRAVAAGSIALSDAVCRAGWCIAVAGAPDADGDIVSVSRIGGAPQPVIVGGPDAREPAFLVR